MPKKDITTFQKAINCIPQVYFDIIGRIIPGTLLIGSTWLAIRGPDEFWKSLINCIDKSSASSITVSAILIFLTSYTLAYLIWCPWSCLTTIIFEKLKKAGVMKGFLKKVYWDNKEFRYNYEKLKYRNNVAGNRITKLKAQIHMTETLIAGFPLSFLIGLVVYIWSLFDSNMETPSLIYCMVSWLLLISAAVCSLFSRQYFVVHMKDSLKNNLKLIEDKKKI